MMAVMGGLDGDIYRQVIADHVLDSFNVIESNMSRKIIPLIRFCVVGLFHRLWLAPRFKSKLSPLLVNDLF